MARKKEFQSPDLTVAELSHALYEANQKLNDSNSRLREINEQMYQTQQSRLQIYANVSHDLRAPVTAISNFTEYLMSQCHTDDDAKMYLTIEPEELYQTLSLISLRTGYLRTLINDIFLLSSLEYSDQRLKPEPVQVGFFLEDYFYMCEADSFYSNSTLKLDIPDDFNCTMMMDPQMMQRVLDNLFTNAVKYSGPHPVITLHACVDRSASGQFLIICVEDQGSGISAEHLPHIFDYSYRVDSARTPNADSGSGLGLAIVRAIVERHHGQVFCDSAPMKGSRFIMKFELTTPTT